MAWTPEQELAINETGTNIIVSAGAGSGKTAVLTRENGRNAPDPGNINSSTYSTYNAYTRIRNSRK